MALAEKTLPADFVIMPALANAIRAKVQAEHLACAAAFSIAAEQAVAPLLVGQTADALTIHLSHCQLGLFGYPGHTKGWEAAGSAAQPVPAGLEDALQEAGAHGPLACATLWALATQFRVSRMLVGYTADRLGIKIAPCQLGAF